MTKMVSIDRQIQSCLLEATLEHQEDEAKKMWSYSEKLITLAQSYRAQLEAVQRQLERTQDRLSHTSSMLDKAAERLQEIDRCGDVGHITDEDGTCILCGMYIDDSIEPDIDVSEALEELRVQLNRESSWMRI